MYLGIDVGGTNIAAGIVDVDGNILHQISVPTKTQRGYKAVLNNIIKVIDELNSKKFDIHAIGIGIPGVVDSDLKTVRYCPNLNWNRCNLVDDLKDVSSSLTIPIFVDNDANLATIAELEVGSIMNVKNAVMITLGTGIGGGIVSDGKILRGFYGLGCEVGHMIIGENFYNCNCGNNGCFETFASAKAVIKYTKHILQRGVYSDCEGHRVLMEILKTREFGAKEVMDLAKKGDALGLDAFNRLIKYLSIGIVNIIHMLDPQKIVIGGGLSNVGDFLIESLNNQIASKHFIKDYPFAQIIKAQLGNDAGIVGAGMLAKQEL